MSALQRWQNGYALMSVPGPARCGWEAVRGEQGAARRGPAREADPGRADPWGGNRAAQTTLLSIRDCSAAALFQPRFSPVFREKHPAQQQNVWSLARTPALMQLPAMPCSAGYQWWQVWPALSFQCGPKSLTLLQECLNSAISCSGVSLPFYRIASWCA